MEGISVKKTAFFTVLLIFCIGICAKNATPDYDLWARLIAGAFTVETHNILKHDFLSYTPTHLWLDHEWGSSAVFYTVLKYFGAEGLVVLRGLLLYLTIIFCFLTIKERNPKSTTPYNLLFYVLMFLCAVKSTGNAVRCLLFTSLFFSISIYILERARNGKNKTLFLIPLIMIPWCNMHGGCLSLLGILVFYIMGEFLNGKSVKKYVAVLVACVAVMFVNPYGFDYVKFLFEAGTMKRTLIKEWASPFIFKHLKMFFDYKIYLVLMWVSLIFGLVKNKPKYKEIDKTKILIILLLTYLSVTHIRHISFFVFTAGTFLYDDFYFLVNKITGGIKNKNVISIKEILVYGLLATVTMPYFAGKKEISIASTEYPRYAVEFIKINNIKGNLFVNFDWGSYCAYKLYPNNLIVMDGRYEEVYDPALLLLMKDFHLVENDWYKIIRDYPADVMILEKKYPVFDKISEMPEWTNVFENNLSGVFVRSENVKDEYIYPVANAKYYDKKLFETDINFSKDK